MSKKGIALFLAFLMLFSIFTPQMTTYAATTENIEEVTTSEDTNENDLEQSTEEPENTGQNTEITSTESVEESTEQSTEQSTEAEPDAQAAPTGAPVTLSDDGMSDVVLETFTRAIEGDVQYYGGVKYKNTTVAHFTIDGKPAFCMQHGVTAPTTGTSYSSSVYEDENVRRILYYGWQGQSQWSGFDGNENKGIVITSLALSHYFYNSPANVDNSYYIGMGLKDFIDYCNANSIPDSRISFSTDSVKAYRSGDIQKTDDITINGWSGNNLSFTLQDGVKAVTNDGETYTGNVTLNGGTTFHLEAPLTVNVDWSTGTVGGSVKKFNALIWRTGGSYQTAGGWESVTDPLGETSLAVDWLDVGNLQINKYNGLGELVDGAKFRVQALNDGNTYDQIVTVTNGSLLLENILSGDYKVTEVQTPNSVSGTGYLLDPNNEYTVTVEPGATKTLNVVNYEPSGQITLTKRDSETGTAQGSATLQGAVYQLSASTNIVRANGEIVYTAGQVIGNAATDANGQIVWNGLYPGGSYAIKEIQPSDGYNLDTSTYIVELNFKDSSTAVVTASRVSYEKVIRSDIELSKFGTDSVDTENTKKIPLKGVIFSIQSLTTNQKWYMVTNENGYIDSVTDKIYSKVNTTNGTVKVDASSVVTRNSRGMFPRDTYLITELNTPAGYMPIQPMTVVLDKQSYKYQWILEDKDIISALRVEKTDAETGQVIPIANTSFHLYDAQGKQIKMVASRYPTTQYIDEFATDESGTFTLPEKLQIGTYYLEEVNAPDGYLKGQRMKFDITSGHDWSQPFTIQYANTPAKGKIKIVKTDSETAEPVEGAVYEIYADGDIKTGDNTIRNTSGELIDTVTTDDTGTALSKELYLGNYTVKEKETPDGYKLDTEEHKVSVEYADAVTPVVIATLEVEDEPNNIFIQKIDSETEKTLPGATLQLIDADKKVVDEWTTDGKPHSLYAIAKGTYTLHEKEVPNGYVRAKDMEIEIIETADMQQFVMKDKRVGGIVTSMTKPTPEKETPGTINTKMHLKTGDTNNILLWLLIFAGSGAVIAVLILSRKKGKRSRIGIFLLMFVMLAASTPNKVYAAEPEVTKEHEYTSKNKEEEYTGFKETIEEDGRKYNLSGITYDIEKTTPEKEKKVLTKEVDSDLIPVSEEYTPEQTITEDNVTYTLNDCTVLDDSEEVKNYTSYVDYLDEAAIPDSKVITVTGENGEKLQLQGKVAKKEVISNGEWLNTQITITFDHYDSGEYVWQGETIYNSSNPLEGHYAELLQSVGADSNTHRITSTQWSGDAYEVDGVTYRDAIANVQYFVPYTRATYAASQEYVKYRATYAAETEVDSKTNFTYDLKATATYELDKSLTVKQIVIMAGVGLLIIVVLIVLILYVVSRRKKDKEPQKRREVKVSYCIRKGSGKAVEKKWKKEIKNAPDK